MTTDTWLARATRRLKIAGIETARLDCLVLLEDILGIDRAMLLARPEHEITTAQIAKLEKLLKQRAKHEPLAYVRGHSEFYGRNFVITPAVLVPRPESEVMIDLLGELSATGKLVLPAAKSAQIGDFDLKLADVGAGSGALGITAKLEFPAALNVRVDLLEIDLQALEIAKLNVNKLTTAIDCVESDVLDGSAQDYDVLLCNLPYVPDGYEVNQAAGHEPRIALFGGPDGLDVYRKLLHQVSAIKKQPLFILTESLPAQHHDLEALALRHDYELARSEGLIQVFRSMDLQAT